MKVRAAAFRFRGGAEFFRGWGRSSYVHVALFHRHRSRGGGSNFRKPFSECFDPLAIGKTNSRNWLEEDGKWKVTDRLIYSSWISFPWLLSSFINSGHLDIFAASKNKPKVIAVMEEESSECPSPPSTNTHREAPQLNTHLSLSISSSLNADEVQLRMLRTKVSQNAERLEWNRDRENSSHYRIGRRGWSMWL